MKLYYSGASAFWNPQNKALLSLGGWVSNTPIPNSISGNIFGDVSSMSIEKKLSEYRLIVLKNELATNVIDILLHFVYPVTYPFVKYLVSIVQPSGGSDGEYYFEKLDSVYSSPLYITEWYEADGPLNAINIGNLAVGGFLGIWIKREFLAAVDSYFTDDFLITNYKNGTPVVIPNTDITNLKLDWTIVP